jgi:hypothetical protein
MKGKDDRRVSPAMVEDKEAEKRKKREQAAGRLVITDERKPTSPARQTRPVETKWLNEPSDEAIYRALKILLGLARAQELRAAQSASAVFAVAHTRRDRKGRSDEPHS